MSRRPSLSDHEVRLIRLEHEIMKRTVHDLASEYNVRSAAITYALSRDHPFDLVFQPDIFIP